MGLGGGAGWAYTGDGMTRKQRRARARARWKNWKPAPKRTDEPKLLPFEDLIERIFKVDRTVGILVRR